MTVIIVVDVMICPNSDYDGTIVMRIVYKYVIVTSTLTSSVARCTDSSGNV